MMPVLSIEKIKSPRLRERYPEILVIKETPSDGSLLEPRLTNLRLPATSLVGFLRLSRRFAIPT